MKRRVLPAALLLAAALVLALPWLRGGWRFLRGVDLSGEIAEFHYYSGGQFWGTDREIVTKDGAAWAVCSHREYGPMVEQTRDQDQVRSEGGLRQTALTEEQLEEFSRLVLGRARLPLWKEHYEPVAMVTCGDGWRIVCVLKDGRTYQTSGYMVYPDGLSLIGGFFKELFPGE